MCVCVCVCVCVKQFASKEDDDTEEKVNLIDLLWLVLHTWTHTQTRQRGWFKNRWNLSHVAEQIAPKGVFSRVQMVRTPSILHCRRGNLLYTHEHLAPRESISSFLRTTEWSPIFPTLLVGIHTRKPRIKGN